MATANAGNIVVNLLFRDTGLSAGLGAAVGKLNSFSASVQTMAQRLDRTLTRALQATTLAAGAFSGAMIVTGSRFEAVMSEVGAVSKATAEDMQRLEAEARRIGSTTAFTAAEAGEAMIELARAGMRTNEILSATADVVNFAGANNFDLATSAELVAATLQQFQMDASETTRVVDAFTNATQNSLFSANSLRESFKFAGTAAAAVGMDIEEATAAVAQFRNLGLEGSLAGTNFRMAMISLVAPTEQAKKRLAEMNLTLDEVNPQVVGFEQAFRNLADAGLDAQSANDIFTTRVATNAVQISKAIQKQTDDTAGGFAWLVRQLREGAGRTQTTYAEMIDNVRGQFKLFTSALSELFITVFERIQGPLSDLLSGLSDRINAISAVMRVAGEESSDVLDNIVDGILSVVDTITVMMPVLKELAMLMFGAFVVVRGVLLIGQLQAIATQISLFTTSLIGTLGPAGMVVAAVGALAFAFLQLTGSMERANDEMDRIKGLQEGLDIAEQRREDRTARVGRLVEAEQAAARKMLEEAQAGTRELTREEQNRLLAVTQLTAASAEQMLKNGQLLEVNGRLVRTEEALRENQEATRSMMQEDLQTLQSQIAFREQQIEAIERTSKAIEENGEVTQSQFNFLKSIADQEGLDMNLDRDFADMGSPTVALQDTARLLALMRTEQDEATASLASMRSGFSAVQIKMLETADAAEQLGKGRGADAMREFQSKITDVTIEGIDHLEELGGQATAVGHEMAAALDGVKPPRRVVSSFEGVFNRVRAFFGDLDGHAERTIGQLQRVATSAAGKVRGFIDNARTKIEAVGFGEFVADELRQVDRLVFRGMELLGKAMLKTMELAARGILHVFDAMGRKLLDTFMDIGRNIASGIGRVFNEVVGQYLNPILLALDVAGTVAGGRDQARDILEDGRRRADELRAEGDEEGADQALQEAARRAQEVRLDTSPQQVMEDMMTMAMDFVNSLIQSLPVVVAQLATELPKLVTQLVRAIPDVMDALIASIPDLIDALVDAIPDLVEGIVSKLPELIDKVLAKLPDIIEALGDAIVTIIEYLPEIVEAILEHLPAIITALVDQIPKIITALVEAIPAIIRAVIDALPDIIIALIEAIPVIFGAILKEAPKLIVELLKIFFFELPVELIAAMPKILKALGEAIVEIGKDIGEAFLEIVSLGLFRTRAERENRENETDEERRARRSENREKAAWTALDVLTLGTSFLIRKAAQRNNEDGRNADQRLQSGIQYVPRTMTTVLEPGEGVINAMDNARRLQAIQGGTEFTPPGPGYGSEHSKRSITEILVQLDSRVVDAQLFDAARRGQATRLRRAMRSPGVRVGLNRGRANVWGD